MDKSEINQFDKVPEDMDIELNVSPNTEESMVKEGLKPFLNNKRNWCIIKLSPTETYNIDRFYEMVFGNFMHQIHCLVKEEVYLVKY